ncbi:MAG: TonB-dependent receptor [Gammaproteobacteria bacterium]
MTIRLQPSLTLLAALALPSATAVAETPAPEADNTLDEITVTGTREARPLGETPATVDVVNQDTISTARPAHPRDVLNQLPGVRVSNLSGEGHSTSIRHPLTTAPVYLYLEDGIPTRSTGFFNHNALYEINVPQSGGIEVTKGPGSALYGSDAIGGTVNVLTRTPPAQKEGDVTIEGGHWGWGRLLVSTGDSRDNDAWRISLNATHSDGWQDAAGYDRQTGTLRWDRAIDDTTVLKNVFSFSVVDQNHVGSLNAAEFAVDPQRNNIPFSYRQVKAFRVSSAYEREQDNSLLSVTPYLRKNTMEILPSWTVSYDPNRYDTENLSAGLLTKYRMDFSPLRTRVIAGLDLDYSPGSRDEDSISLSKTTNAEGGTTYALNNAVAPVQIYDYDVAFTGISPYVHVELSPVEKLRLTLGVRYDQMEYDYQNNFNGGAAAATQGVLGAFPGNGWYGHVASTRVDYQHTSPKVGATWAFNDKLDAFLSASNAFRVPSEGQVFRGSRESNATRAQAAAESLLALKPVEIDNLEAGLRGRLGDARYTLSVYRMEKTDDIVSYTDPVTNERRVVNAGETSHRGVEAGAQTPLIAGLLDVAGGVAWSEHRYETWIVSGTADYSGKEMEAAPRTMGNLRLIYTPGFMAGGRIQLEWQHLGNYWLDQSNTAKYAGHELFNLSLNRPFGDKVELYGSVRNLLDEKHAETASLSSGAPSYTAGLPLTANAGITLRW